MLFLINNVNGIGLTAARDKLLDKAQYPYSGAPQHHDEDKSAWN